MIFEEFAERKFKKRKKNASKNSLICTKCTFDSYINTSHRLHTNFGLTVNNKVMSSNINRPRGSPS